MQKNNEKSYYQMRCDFYEKFNTKIIPELKHIEKLRIKKCKKIDFLYLALLIMIIICICLFVVFLAQFPRLDAEPDSALINIGISVTLFIILIYPLILVGFNLEKNIIAINKQVKNLVLPIITSCYANLKWHYGIYCGNLNEILNSSVIPVNYPLVFEDIFEGIYKNVPFEMIEAHQAQDTDISGFALVETYGKRSYGRRHFSGVIIKIKMNKNFNGHTVILPADPLQISSVPNLKCTELEDVNFEKKFDVFTDDEIEARYLITTAFMERLTNLKTAFSAGKISCAFYGANFYLALYSKEDLFSIGSIKKPVNNLNQYEQMFNEIISIYKMIDHFKLNEGTGL